MRPDSIGKFDMLFLGMVFLGLLNAAIGYDELSVWFDAQAAAAGLENGEVLLGVSLIFGLVLNCALWFLVSRLGIEFVKWILLLLLILGLIGLPALFTDGLGAADVLPLISYVLNAAAIYFLFQPDTTAWFAEKAGRG